VDKNNNFVWMDLEMTGLEVEYCHIIEIACIITDKKLEIIAEAEPIVIYQPYEIVNSMNDWCKKVHGKNGLIEKVEKSKISLQRAEDIILSFIKKYVGENSSPLCGNSVWQDKKFLSKYMPRIENYLHYRILDVSSFGIAYKTWKPSPISRFQKKNTHSALSDIKESIEEMRFYKKNLLSI